MKKAIVVAILLILPVMENVFSGGITEKDGQIYFSCCYGSQILESLIEEGGFSFDFSQAIKLLGANRAFGEKTFRFGLLGCTISAKTLNNGDNFGFMAFSPDDIAGFDETGIEDIEGFYEDFEYEAMSTVFTGSSSVSVKRGIFYWLYGSIKFEGRNPVIEIKYIEPYF